MEGNGIQLGKSGKNKVEELKGVLGEEVIDVRRLRRVVNKGVPDEVPELREVAWKVLLKYLPDHKSRWNQVQEGYKQTYSELVEKFMNAEEYPDYPIFLERTHPEYSTRVKDYELWEQIQKDVTRTRSSISFFSQKTSATIIIPYLTQARKEKFKQSYCQNNYSKFLHDKGQQRINYIHDHMSRILFIYSKLNPNVGYVQGMNQILAPIFFTVNNHRPLNSIDQQSCFFLLNSLLAEVIDLHIVDMDKSSDGIYGKVNLINSTLKLIEPVLWMQLRNKNVDPVCYNFKWLVLLFAQQFQIFDVCRLWDTLLTYKNIKMYLICVSLALIQLRHEQIEQGDSIEILRALQELRDENIEQIIENSSEIYRMIGKKDLEKLIQENQRHLQPDDD